MKHECRAEQCANTRDKGARAELGEGVMTPVWGHHIVTGLGPAIEADDETVAFLTTQGIH
jgi:hypothetical protein